MYNLLVGFPDDEAYAERVVEHTDEAIRSYIEPGGRLDTSRLLNLPTLVLPEVGNNQPQIARVGRLESMKLSGKVYHFRFTPSPTMPAIPSARIGALGARLGISDWELRRTHWAVKDVDLHHVLHEVPSTAPAVFRLPLNRPQERDLVAVMMPSTSASIRFTRLCAERPQTRACAVSALTTSGNMRTSWTTSSASSGARSS